MKQGSSIHKTLEDEIHTTVPVEVNTKEDAWALRIWNVIQGLRTLREFGTTRELEVWGVVDGEVVNGIIDQLGYESSDPEMEMQAEGFYNEIERSRSMLPEYQMSLTDYLLSEAQGGKRLGEVWEGGEGEGKGEKGKEIEDEPAAHTGNDVYSIPRIYLTDVKTRGSRSVPTVKSSPFRPTLLQLQLYFHLLTRMVVSDDISISVLADRYDLDPTRRFTDGFIAEVGGLNGQFFDALDSRTFDPDYIPTPDEASRHSPSHDPSSPSSPPPSSSQDSTSILLEHNTLTSLWSLMKHQLRLTFLLPAQETAGVAPSIPAEKQPEVLNEYRTLLSPLLTARFISATAGADSSKRVLGSRSFLFDPTSLSTHLADQMEWWRGERDPRGVEVVEAWKCRLCEFSEGCSWRQEKEWSLAGRKRRSRGSA